MDQIKWMYSRMPNHNQKLASYFWPFLKFNCCFHHSCCITVCCFESYRACLTRSNKIKNGLFPSERLGELFPSPIWPVRFFWNYVHSLFLLFIFYLFFVVTYLYSLWNNVFMKYMFHSLLVYFVFCYFFHFILCLTLSWLESFRVKE